MAALLGVVVCAGFVASAAASPRSVGAAGGATWSAPIRMDSGLHGRYVRAVSCPSSKFCAAVDEEGRVVFYHGSWAKPASVDSALHGDDVLVSISCTDQSFCVTFNAQGDVFVYNGHQWRGPGALWSAGIYEHGQVSCPRTSFCVLENGHRLYMYLNGHWSAGPRLPATGVSCPSKNFCVAVSRSGGSSSASVYRSKWRAPRVVDRGSAVSSVSCASAGFCFAGGAKLVRGHADAGGTVVRYRGHGWSKPTTIQSAPTGPTSMACPSNRFCAAVDAAGNALTFDGISWSPPIPVDSQHAHGKGMWVSCPSSSFCMAVDAFGYAMRRRSRS